MNSLLHIDHYPTLGVTYSLFPFRHITRLHVDFAVMLKDVMFMRKLVCQSQIIPYLNAFSLVIILSRELNRSKLISLSKKKKSTLNGKNLLPL